jgi:protein MAK11
VHHAGSVNALAFAPDPVSGASFLFSAADDMSVCVTRTSDWRLVKKLAGHTAPVTDIAIHPSSKVALTLASDRSLFMWNLVKGKVAFSAKTKPGSASSVVWSPSGEHYVLTSLNTAALYNAEGQLVACFAHDTTVHSAAFLDDRRVVTGGEDKIVRVWDARSGDVVAEPATHDMRVRAVSTAPGVVASADTGGGFKIWDEKRGGAPRIETCIGGGGMRLTCMTIGLETAEVKAREGKNARRRARAEEAAAKDAEGGDAEDSQETPRKSKPGAPKAGTASSRKRSKRKGKVAGI